LRAKASFYIDGLNLYHSIHELGQPHLKWLNVKDLALRVCAQAKLDLQDVKYFNAPPIHRSMGKQKRFQLYVEALESTGVNCRLGRFKPKPQHCKACTSKWTQHEEKETDVNIAIEIVADAYKGQFDVCYLVTRDSDLSGPVRLLKRDFPSIQTVTVAPPGRRHSKELVALCDSKIALRPRFLQNCLLPQTITLSSGHSIQRPPQYAPPKTT